MSHSLGRVSLPAIRFQVHGRDESRWQAGAQSKGSGIITWAAPVELSGALKGHLLTFYNAYPPTFPGPPGFQVGWAILNASDPTTVIAR
jgi:hypothetical protein